LRLLDWRALASFLGRSRRVHEVVVKAHGSMATLFCVRPATRNIGNDLINRATSDLIQSVFGPDTAIVNIPALRDTHFGGLTASQVYDMNRFADGVVIGGGNLFENGQLTIDEQALAALRVPLMLIGMSHGRIYDRDGEFTDRTDAMPPDTIRRLAEKASVVLVRDAGSKRILDGLGVERTQVGGCPSLFMAPNAADDVPGERVLLSIRHPSQMCVAPELQWRVADDIRRLTAALEDEYGRNVYLVCHDYRDIELAKGFPRTPLLYFDDVGAYVAALRGCRLSVSYRLHAFLPCLAFGTPSIHLSYDERGKEMVAAAGMGDWDIDLPRERDMVAAVMSRVRSLERYRDLRLAAQVAIEAMRATSLEGVRRFADAVEKRRPPDRRPS
jgi:polysaccharide pyruvyl transferase WcaK-like protein